MKGSMNSLDIWSREDGYEGFFFHIPTIIFNQWYKCFIKSHAFQFLNIFNFCSQSSIILHRKKIHIFDSKGHYLCSMCLHRCLYVIHLPIHVKYNFKILPVTVWTLLTIRKTQSKNGRQGKIFRRWRSDLSPIQEQRCVSTFTSTFFNKLSINFNTL